MKHRTRLPLALLICAFAVHGGVITANVSLATSPLAGHPAGPFLLALSFTDGAGIGNGTNLAFVTQIDFGVGGAPLGNPQVGGDVLGDVNSGLLFTDTQPYNYVFQSFEPGDKLTFILTLTSNVDDPTPDVFTVAILDSNRVPIPTFDGAPLDFLLRIDITSDSPDILVWAGDPARSPSAGGPAIALAAPVIGSDVPEPITFPILASLLIAIIFRARSLRWHTEKRTIAGSQQGQGVRHF